MALIPESPNPRSLRLAIVVQRYGEEVNGGAELHARWLAEHLTGLAEVHVVTTCAVEYTTWADYYRPGDSQLNGVSVHRFPVDRPRRWSHFQKLTGTLVQRDHSLLDEWAWMGQQGPFSTPLFNFLRQSYPHFDAFIFVTYLYATTFFGLPLVSDKAILVPTAHDDPYLHLPLFRPTFHLPRYIVYNTRTEQELVGRVTHNQAVPQIVAGVGINVPADYSAARFRQETGITGDFALYLGRMDESKNVPELLAHFLRYRQEDGRPLKLVLAGKSHIPLPDHPDVVALGFVSEQRKFDALAAAALVVVPSLYESLSMLALEAWLMGRPVLVNGGCQVLKDQCRQSNGGLYYTSYEEFAAGLTTLLERPDLRAQLGDQGRRFALAQYSWEVVLAKYRAILDNW
ncbi:MAG: glycosyltransferase [Chloroflexota bacterium]